MQARAVILQICNWIDYIDYIDQYNNETSKIQTVRPRRYNPTSKSNWEDIYLKEGSNVMAGSLQKSIILLLLQHLVLLFDVRMRSIEPKWVLSLFLPPQKHTHTRS